MKRVDTRFWIELAVITIVMVGLGWVAFHFLWPGQYPPYLSLLLALMVVMTVAGQVILTRTLTEKFSKFNTAFMLFKVVKMFVLMAFLIVYLLISREHAVPLLGSALVLYLVFMIFESRSLNRHSRNQEVG